MNNIVITQKSIPLSKDQMVQYTMKKKKKKYDAGLETYLYNKKNKVNPLANTRPRKGVRRIVENETPEVRNILYPFIREYISSRLCYRKMPKKSSNDRRNYLLEYFGKVKSKYTNSLTGTTMVEQIFVENEEKFTKDEIINTLINIIYQQKLDYLSFRFREHIKTTTDKSESLSLWSKFSEKCHS